MFLAIISVAATIISLEYGLKGGDPMLYSPSEEAFLILAEKKGITQDDIREAEYLCQEEEEKARKKEWDYLNSDSLTFTLKKEHITLIQNFNVNWQNCETGAPIIDSKRPYGNSSVAYDVAELLGVKPKNDDELTYKQEDQLLRLHRQTQIALQVVLSSKSFKPGKFKRKNTYTGKWVRQ